MRNLLNLIKKEIDLAANLPRAFGDFRVQRRCGLQMGVAQIFKIDGDNFKSIKKDGERPYSGVHIKTSRAKEAQYIDIDILEKNSIKDNDFMEYLHKWSKINIKKIYICPGETEDEYQYQNVYYKCDGKWYFCTKGLSLKTIKENEMLDSSVIEKIEESIAK